MKILVFGQIFPDSFARNIAVTLDAMGHQVFTSPHFSMNIGLGRRFVQRFKIINYAERFFPWLEKWAQENLIKIAAEVKPDLIIIPGEQPHPAVIHRLKQNVKSKVVQWMSDALTSFGRQYILASDYDALFFKDEYVVQFVREKLDKRAYFLPQACNPIWHHRIELTNEEIQKYGCELTIASNLYWYRALMLEQFMNYDIKLWGPLAPSWMESPVKRFNQRRYVAELEKAKAYNATKIVLNVMHYAEILGCNLRLFETAGCGAFQVVDWRPNLYKFLEPGSEVVTFNTRQELKEKVDYYLAHDGERQLIADRGYARAHAEHTYRHRLIKLIDWTFNGNPNVD